jgi:hypothetical protein
MTLAVELTTNSIIYVQTQSGMVFDANQGHDVPSYVDTAVAAFLENDSRARNGDRYDQKEAPFQHEITGFADSPICTTTKVNHRAVMSGVQGRIYLDPVTQEASVYHYDLSHLTGYPIKGYFVPGKE